MRVRIDRIGYWVAIPLAWMWFGWKMAVIIMLTSIVIEWKS